MSPQVENAMDNLVHDVHSKCDGLKNAVTLLRKASPADAGELLALMAEQARNLAQVIADFDRGRSGG